MNSSARRCAIEYDTVPPSMWTAPRLRRAEDLVPGHDHRHFVLGRAALRWLCRALGWRSGDRVLMPAYTCESLVDPFVAEGVTVDFYAVNEDLSVDLDDLMRRLPGARGGVLIHFFGWPQPPEVRRWLAERAPADGYWVEDITHALLTTTAEGRLGHGGDAVLMSYRKLFACAEGCVLSFKASAPARRLSFEASGRYRTHAALRYARMALGGAVGLTYKRRGSLVRWFDTRLRELRIHEPIEVGEMSPLSRYIVERSETVAAAAARRANAAHLMRLMGAIPGVAPVFAQLPDGVVPGLLPVRIAAGRRDAVQRRLHDEAIEAHFHWRRPKELPVGQHPVADRLRDEQLSLPIDERYDGRDMERIASVIRAALAPSTSTQAVGRSPGIAFSG